MIKLLAGIALPKGCEVQHDLMSVLTVWGFFDTLKKYHRHKACGIFSVLLTSKGS
jgi:hypothetical protein